jgi:hypothetical protein
VGFKKANGVGFGEIQFFVHFPTLGTFAILKEYLSCSLWEHHWYTWKHLGIQGWTRIVNVADITEQLISVSVHSTQEKFLVPFVKT